MKNLEIEYKQQIANEVPDLWSRIEVGITAVDNERKNNNVVSLEQAKPKKKVNILKYSAIIGAAACALIVVVAMINNGGSRNYAPTAEAPSATYFDAAPSEDAACEAEVCEEATYEDAACEETAYEEAASEAPSYVEEATYSNDESAESAATEGEETFNATQKAFKSVEAPYAGFTIVGTLSNIDDEDNYLIISVKCDDTDMYIFVPENKMEEVSGLNIDDDYEFTVYEYADDKHQEIADNEDVKYEYLGVYLDN